jgi:hypothetical protein
MSGDHVLVDGISSLIERVGIDGQSAPLFEQTVMDVRL